MSITRPVLAVVLGIGSIIVANAAERLQQISQADGSRRVQFDIFLPLTHRAELDQLLEAQQTPGSSLYHQWLTPEQFSKRFGANQEDLAKVRASVQNYGLQVLASHANGVRVEGTIDSVEHLFKTPIWDAKDKRGRSKLVAHDRLSMPDVLLQTRATVAEFSPFIRHKVHSKVVAVVNGKADPNNRTSPIGGYWFTDLKQAYNFPSYKSLTGKGVNIGILMASDFSDDDMTAYFGHEKLSPPKIVRHPVAGGAPFDPASGASDEITLDIQQSGGMAPGSTIYDYNIPDLSDTNILAGYTEIIETNEVDIVNSSFGGFEAQYFASYNGGQDFSGILEVYDDLFKQGNAQGITFVASSGDSGGLGAPPVEYITSPPTDPESVTGYFLPGVETPASSPHVTAVGGTNLVTTYDASGASFDSRYVRENANGDPEEPYDPYGFGNNVGGGYWGSGGGISEYYSKPGFQNLVETGSANFRTIPDVSLHMGGCPGGISYLPCGPDRSYVIAVIGGETLGLIGTSASSPDFAGLLALREELVPGRMGNANTFIYSRAHEQFSGSKDVFYFHTKGPGFNGYYMTHQGYDMVLGNGTVNARDFIGAADLPGAGEPGAPSNP